jgi:hypothetical protein
MKDQIQQKIIEMIGEDDVYTDDLPPDEEYATEAYNQAKQQMRDKSPQLAQEILSLAVGEIEKKIKNKETGTGQQYWTQRIRNEAFESIINLLNK